MKYSKECGIITENNVIQVKNMKLLVKFLQVKYVPLRDLQKLKQGRGLAQMWVLCRHILNLC